MKKMLNGFLIVIIVFLFLSCDSGSSSESSNEATLDGSWAQSQFYYNNDGYDDTIGTADDEWDKVEITYSGNTATWTFYTNEGISKPTTSTVKYIWTTTYTTGDNVSTPVGGTKINYTSVQITATPLTAATVTEMNSDTVFGFNDWVLNVAKDISGIDDMPSAGDIFYDVYKIETDNLYIGDDEIDLSYDGSTDANRPQVFQNVLIAE